MKCIRCASEIPDGSRFCSNCGLRASDPHAETVMVEVEDPDTLLHRVRLVFAGEYEVDSELARGGMAIVFRATEVGLSRPVALKILRPDIGLSVAAAERFKREAQTVASLDHPNIIPVYRVGQVGGIFHIAMKFVEGRSLGAILESQGALPIPVVLAVLRAATRALSFAHEREIVHRDVKGANILVDVDGRLMVSDFGVALRAADVTLTAAGTVIGTPAFMSPEQCAGRRAGPQSDQYSLGVVAFQMLTGSVPFRAENLVEMMQHHFFTPAPDVEGVRDDVPAPLVGVVKRALAKDPEQRFGSTAEMLAAVEAVPFSERDRRDSVELLHRLARGDSMPKIETGELPPLPDQPTMHMHVGRGRLGLRSPRRVAGLAAIVVAAVAGAALWIGRPASAPPPSPSRDTALTSPTVPPLRTAERGSGGEARTAQRGSGGEARAPLSPGGSVRIRTIPANAEILIDGRRVGVGSAIDVRVPVGARHVQVRAAGYQPWDTTVVIESRRTSSLGTVKLRPGAAGT